MKGVKSKFRINWRKYGKGNSPFLAQPDGTKICTKCGAKKDASKDFQKNRRKTDGLYSWCSACANAKTISWIKNNREQHKKIMRAYTNRQWEKILEGYGRKCACCGESNPGLLTLGHVNNDGAAHRASLMGTKGGKKNPRGGGRTFYTWVIRNNFPPIVRLECFNCNCGAACNGGVCPHIADRAEPFVENHAEQLGRFITGGG